MRPHDSMQKHPISTIYVLVLIICLRAGSANAPAPSTIRVGYPQLNGGQIPLWNIPEQRLDRQYGLDIKPVYIPGGVSLTPSALSGSVDIALTGGAAINAMLSGAEMIYVGMPVPTYAFSLYARPEIKDVTDLRGKTLGDHQRCIVRSCFHRSPPTVQMTQHDLKVLYFSRQEDALAALHQGLVQAAVHSPPTTLMARRLGYKELVNIGSLKLPYPFMGVAIRRSAVQQSPETIRGFLKAFVAGLKIAIEQPDVSKRAAARDLATKDQEIIDEAYNGFAPLFPKIPYVTDEAIRSALSVTGHPKAASANPKDFYDNRFLQELESSGFVKELYAAK